MGVASFKMPLPVENSLIVSREEFLGGALSVCDLKKRKKERKKEKERKEN